MRSYRAVLFASAYTEAIALGTPDSSAATISFSGNSPLPAGDFMTTNFINAVLVGKFDTNLGTLLSVSFSLTGNVRGSVQIESLDAAPATVNSSLSAIITLEKPDGTDLAVTLPVASFSDSLAAFDGLIDFGGTSGISRSAILATNSANIISTTAAILNDFSAAGGGLINLQITAAGASIATGSGNLFAGFRTAANAAFTVTYTYDTGATAVPIPAALSLFGMGLLGLGLARRATI